MSNIIAGDLVAWRVDGNYDLEGGQFRYCYTDGPHLGEVIVNEGYSEKALRDFLNRHCPDDKKQREYYTRIAPRVWKGKLFGAPLPVGESILPKNINYSNFKKTRPEFPILNRLTWLNLLQQCRRLFQIRFLIHHGFSRAAMTVDILSTIENNFIEIFLPECDENIKYLYEKNYSYLHQSDTGEFLYDKYISLFQKPALYGCIENLYLITEWNYAELENALQPFEAIVNNLLGFKFHSNAAKYTKRVDYTKPNWRVGRMIEGSIITDPKWDECDDSGPILYDAFVTEIKNIIQNPKHKDHSKNDSLYNYSTITKYVRYLAKREKKKVDVNTFKSIKYHQLLKSHQRLLHLVFCGDVMDESDAFKKPSGDTAVKRALYLARFLDDHEGVEEMVDLFSDDKLTTKKRVKLADAIHESTTNVSFV